MKRCALFVSVFMLLMSGCVKETYDMDKLSNKNQFSPGLSAAAFKGSVTFSQMVKPSDTVVFDQDKFVRLFFRKDSIINLKLTDLYSLGNMVSYSHDYIVGNLSISPFQSSVSFSLDEISQGFSSALRNEFVRIDDGALHPFPAFPAITLAEKPYSVFPNFVQATFASGTLDITVFNNLTGPLNGLTLYLYKASDHSVVFGPISIGSIPAGESRGASLSLVGKTITNSMIISASLAGSSGSSSNVLISLANSNVKLDVAGNNLKVSSGRVILPQQAIATNDTKDTISLSPGLGIELESIKTTSGNLNYKVQSSTKLDATLDFTLPSIKRSGVPLQKTITISPGAGSTGSISINNTIADLNTDTKQPFNKVPFQYNLMVSSNNAYVDINSTDMVHFELNMPDPVFDYVKGYFGQKTEALTKDTIDLGIDEILSKIKGDFLISNPVIRVNYSNSFAIPIELGFNGEATRGNKSVSLGLSPLSIAHPVSLTTRDITSSFVIDRNNSSLPQLISLPPSKINFSGSVKMNPLGDPTHLRNNFIFGSSRFLGSLEVEVPMEFRLNNLQLSDTIANELAQNDLSIKEGQMKFKIKNGFPLGASFSLAIRDSKTGAQKTVTAPSFLSPAPVDANGKATGTAESETIINLPADLLTLAKTANQMIVSFTLVTSGNGAKDVKIYSDYRIDFSASFSVKPVINLK